MYYINMRFLAFFCLCTSFAISNPQGVPEITQMHIRSDITYRFATTNVSSTLRNPDPEHDMEANFIVLLPKAAFITYFEMFIDGVLYPGRVKEKEVARQQYERAKKKGQSAGKVSQTTEVGAFKVSVNVAAGSEVYFNLTYQELLQRRFGVYQHVITIKPGQVVPDLQVDVYIRESRGIEVLKVPANLKEYGNTLDSTENKLARVRRLGRNSAHISYSPSPAQQKQDTVNGISGHLVVEYDVQRDLDAGEIQVADGYFVHFFAPTGLTPVKKNVLFILDVSGSMSGLRLKQVKSAMKVIIDDLRPDDKFALMTFSDNVEINPYHRWEHSRRLILATEENKAMAKDMVQDFHVQGGTNINDALVSGLRYLEENKEKVGSGGDTRTSMIIFLTDGQPTTGITSNPQIISNAKQANTFKFPIFSLAFGGGAELPFLAKLSLQNDGLARQIYLDSDPELQLQGFYNEISTPILNDIKIKYVGDSISLDSVTDDSFHNYFDGSEIIVAGRLRDNSINTLVTQVSATGARGYMELDMDVDVEAEERKIHQSDVSKFTERLWAYLTIKKLMDKMVELDDPEEKAEAKAKALELSLKYSFVTPLTSMVVTKPETGGETLDAKKSANDDPKPSPLSPQSNSNAFSRGHRRAHSSQSFVDNDPHFIVSIQGVEEGVCFDIDGEPDAVYQLLHDPARGITVNGKIVAPDQLAPGMKHRRTYFGEIAILIGASSFKLLILPHKILINGQRFSWKDNSDLNADGIRVVVEGRTKVSVLVQEDIVFTVLRHMNKRKMAHKVDYLGFYIEEGGGLALRTHGLIGQFIHLNATILHEEQPRPSRLLLPGVDGHEGHVRREVEVRLGQRRNMALDEHVSCWFVRNNGRGLLEGTHTDYLVERMTTQGGGRVTQGGKRVSQRDNRVTQGDKSVTQGVGGRRDLKANHAERQKLNKISWGSM